jgi:hypothetical protein
VENILEPTRVTLRIAFIAISVGRGAVARPAVGEVHGFIVGWTYLVNNLVYFPSLVSFVAGTVLYLDGDAWLGLGESGWYNAALSLTLLWSIVGGNVIGLGRGKWIQNGRPAASVDASLPLTLRWEDRRR